MTSPTPTPPATRVPAALRAAAVLVLLEGSLLVGYGALLVTFLSWTRATMGVTSTVFFVVYGVGLGFCGWQLFRGRSWTRAPVVLAQLIQLAVAWSFRGGSTVVVALVMALLAVLVLVGVLHPASTRALAADAHAD